jgi:hypothetical protein
MSLLFPSTREGTYTFQNFGKEKAIAKIDFRKKGYS